MLSERACLGISRAESARLTTRSARKFGAREVRMDERNHRVLRLNYEDRCARRDAAEVS